MNSERIFVKLLHRSSFGNQNKYYLTKVWSALVSLTRYEFAFVLSWLAMEN